MNVVRHEVELSCPAMAIPAFIEADLEGLDIGDSIKISAIKLPEGVIPKITDRDFTVATVAAPTIEVEVEEETPEVGEDGEPIEGAEDAEAAEGDAATADKDKEGDSDS